MALEFGLPRRKQIAQNVIGVAVILFVLLTLPARAQNCTGYPDFVCSGVGPACSNGEWVCCSGTECSIPPNEYVCGLEGFGTPTCGSSGWYCNTGGSPIILDTAGKGFKLTSAAQGVKFDISGTGTPVQIAWTAADSGDAFLALDRNHNGKIDNGKELFGNYTEQPASPQPNGFLALAEFDLPAKGGNDDGIIDNNDAVFSHLLIWIDANHDGVSQPDELYSLPSLGIRSISLKYRESRRTDRYGNEFRDKAPVNINAKTRRSRDERVAYDVFFRVLEPSAANPTNGVWQGLDDRHIALLDSVPKTGTSCQLKKRLP